MSQNGPLQALQLVGVTAGVTISFRVRIYNSNGIRVDGFAGSFDDSPVVTLADIKTSALVAGDIAYGELDVWSTTPGATFRADYGVPPDAYSAPLPVGASATDYKTYQFGRAPLE